MAVFARHGYRWTAPEQARRPSGLLGCDCARASRPRGHRFLGVKRQNSWLGPSGSVIPRKLSRKFARVVRTRAQKRILGPPHPQSSFPKYRVGLSSVYLTALQGLLEKLGQSNGPIADVERADECLLSGVKRTWVSSLQISGYDPKRTFKVASLPHLCGGYGPSGNFSANGSGSEYRARARTHNSRLFK